MASTSSTEADADPPADQHGLRRRVVSGYGILNVRENLWLFARIYGVPTAVAHERIDRMLDVVGLTDKAKSRDQPPLDRPAAEDELLPRVHHRPEDPLPRRADARPRRDQRPGDPRVHPRVDEGAARTARCC